MIPSRSLFLHALAFGSQILVATVLGGASALGQTTLRASVDSSGNQSNAGSSQCAISADARYVAFQSNATNLVAGDTNGAQDIFVHDVQTGVTERVSVDSSGNEANAASSQLAISDDGRFVAFRSGASNLVAGDTNGVSDVFVHDRQTGTTERVSISSSGSQGNGHSFFASISGDGSRVAFESGATNLVAGDTNAVNDNFVHDRQTGTTVRVSVDSSGTQATGVSYSPDISADGRYVAFESVAGNLVAGGTSFTGVFVHDTLTGTTELAGVDSSGNEGNNGTHRPSISAAGRYVAFDSGATNLVPGDTNGAYDVFVHDRQTGATELVSTDSAGNQANAASGVASISADGRYVAFESFASNLVPGDTNGTWDVIVRDREAGLSGLASAAPSGNPGNDESTLSSISGSGRYVAFRSLASDLVPGDTNGVSDIFFRDRGCSDLFVNYCTAGTSAGGCVVALSSSGHASASAASGFVVSASFVEGQKDGLFFFGQNGRQANSWGSGTSFQCVVPPVQRGGLQAGAGSVGACDAVISQDLNARWCPTCPKPNQTPAPGAQLQVQFWYRDPLNTSNQTTSLSDALEGDVCP